MSISCSNITVMYQQWASVIFDTIFLMYNQCKEITIHLFCHSKQKPSQQVRNALGFINTDPFLDSKKKG